MFLQKIEASPAALLVKARHHRKILFSLREEKIGCAQIRNRKQNFSLGWRASARGGGAASLVPFKVGSREVYNYSTNKISDTTTVSEILLVRGRGLEPPRPCGQQPLKLQRLPVSPPARLHSFLPIIPSAFSIFSLLRVKQATALS